MLKNWAIVLSSYNSLQCIYSLTPPTTSLIFLRSTTTLDGNPINRPAHQQCRAYAMTTSSYSYSRNEHANLPWPEVTSVSAIPTPYQIFNQRKGSPYSKRRFYELVKLYHPDRHRVDENSDDIPYATKLERYRLVVAANDLLSDPMKRKAYDCYGAGWNGQPGVQLPRDASDVAQSWGDYSGKGWGGGRDGPFQNATWEDWEKWYARDEKTERTPTYFSNGAFVALIVMFAALGGIGQATRVGNYSMTFIEQRDALHDEMSKELMRRRKESNTQGSPEDRVDTFLKRRDPFGSGVTDPEDEGYRRLLPAAEICSSGDIKSRSMDIYDVKKESKGS